MQDNHQEQFDRQIRSMLADAAEKPSRRVWKGISARLDAAEAPAASSWGWMRWAGMSLAAAAAIAAGVFFSGTRTSIPTIIHNPEQAMLAQSGETAGAEAEIAAPAAVPVSGEPSAVADGSRSAFRSASRPAARQAAAADGVEPAPEVPANAAAQEPQAQPASESGRPATAKTPARHPVHVPAVDPFAAEKPEAGRRSLPRPSLYAQGAVGSNESSLRARTPGFLGAPGEQSGFSELGASSYGVPFTVGLGVRFYVAPRLSIGTGLDYSLLSRTFTGSFDATSGSVSHTLQYLGIPVRVYYDILSSDRIKFYVYGGGEAEYCIYNKYRLFGTPDIVRTPKVNGLQYSVGAGLGVEFRIAGRVGLYVDPGMNYYFNCNQPRSIRTEKPFLLNFDAGLRFNF